MKHVSYIQGFFMEFIGAVFLQLVYLYFVENENAPENTDGFSVGAMFGMCILSTNYFTGAAINPARALGPLILSLKFWLIPLYLFAPIVGSICGYLIYSYMLLDLDTEVSRNLRAQKKAQQVQEQQQEEHAKQILAGKKFEEDNITEMQDVSNRQSKISMDGRPSEEFNPKIYFSKNKISRIKNQKNSRTTSCKQQKLRNRLTINCKQPNTLITTNERYNHHDRDFGTVKKCGVSSVLLAITTPIC